jgi:DNA-binding transcriptional LysR family regulator
MAFDSRLLSGMSVLATVIENGSFTRAGTTLGMTASGVSRAVTRLEERLGVRLLDRGTRSLRLTSEGERLYALASPHLAGIEEAAQLTAGAAGQAEGLLRVSVNPVFAHHVLAPALPAFRARYPDVHLLLLPPVEAGALAAEGIDVAIRFGPQPDSSMASRWLLDTRVLTVASPAYVAVHGRPASPDDLAKHECIQFLNPQNGRPFEWELRRGHDVVHVSTAGHATFSDGDAMVAACLAGAGIAQVLALSVERYLAEGSLVELFPDWPDETFPLYAIRPSRRLAPAKVEAFLAYCVEISAHSADSPARWA